MFFLVLEDGAGLGRSTNTLFSLFLRNVYVFLNFRRTEKKHLGTRYLEDHPIQQVVSWGGYQPFISSLTLLSGRVVTKVIHHFRSVTKWGEPPSMIHFWNLKLASCKTSTTPWNILTFFEPKDHPNWNPEKSSAKFQSSVFFGFSKKPSNFQGVYSFSSIPNPGLMTWQSCSARPIIISPRIAPNMSHGAMPLKTDPPTRKNNEPQINNTLENERTAFWTQSHGGFFLQMMVRSSILVMFSLPSRGFLKMWVVHMTIPQKAMEGANGLLEGKFDPQKRLHHQSHSRAHFGTTGWYCWWKKSGQPPACQ